MFYMKIDLKNSFESHEIEHTQLTKKKTKDEG